MALPTHSQNTLTTEPNRIKTYVNEKGDTMVTMHYEDARILLEDLLNCEYSDSLLTVYKERDSLNTSTITMQKSVMDAYVGKISNLEEMNSNLEKVIANKEDELDIKDDIIKDQKREIRKQKILKIIGFTGSIVLPIVTLIALL